METKVTKYLVRVDGILTNLMVEANSVKGAISKLSNSWLNEKDDAEDEQDEIFDVSTEFMIVKPINEDAKLIDVIELKVLGD